MNTQPALTRRRFIQQTASAAAVAGGMMGLAGCSGLNARSPRPAKARVIGANDRLQMAFIGCGGMAKAHLDVLLALRQPDNINIAAVCDVYETRAKGFRDRINSEGGQARHYVDYREVLGRDDIDYVLIATPEHSHAYLTLDAIAAGKHIYCEKPLTHTVEESQAVLAALKPNPWLKLQVGVQGMSDDSYSTAQEAIRAGKIGPVIQAQIDYVRRHSLEWGPWRREEIDPQMVKPADLDWNTWLTPAPRCDWCPRRYFEWRNYKEYSGGIGTDLFVHRITRLIRALGLTLPTRVTGMGGIYLWPDGRSLPDNFEMLAEYPAVEGVTPGMTIHVLGTMANNRGIPHTIRGQKGSLVFDGEGWKIFEHDQDEPVHVHRKSGAEDILLHHQNHHAAIRGQAELKCPPELGYYGLVPVVMANESWFQGKMMAWDARRERVVPA